MSQPNETEAPRSGGWRRAAWWLLVPVGWVLVSLLASAPGGRAILEDGRVEPIPTRVMFVENLAAYGWWALLTPLIVLAVRRIAGWRAPRAARAAAQVAAGVGFILLYFVLRTQLPVPGLRFGLSPGWPGLFSILPNVVGMYLLIAGGALMLAAHARSLAGSARRRRWRCARPGWRRSFRAPAWRCCGRSCIRTFSTTPCTRWPRWWTGSRRRRGGCWRG